jgi:arginyl-tRNA synthetase
MRQKIVEVLKKIIKENVEIEVFVPEDEKFGHYSTNVAFRLAKLKKKSPLEIAEDINLQLTTYNLQLFEKIEIAGNGFINFWLKPEVLQNELKAILKKREKYGQLRLKSKRRNSKIQLEFISANPTGPLTLANARGGFLGDVLAQVLEWAGYKVEREYYVNDTGNQIIKLGRSLLAALGLNDQQLTEKEDLYRGDYIKKWSENHKRIVEKYQNNPLKLGQLAARDFLKEIKETIEKKTKIYFDRYTSEQKQIHNKGFIRKALKIFKKNNLVYKKEGALWLKTTNFGDDKDRVLITSDGFPTYFLADAGHYLETKKRGFNWKINILGPDHYGYVARIQAAAQILGLKKSEVIVTQAVRLVEKGKEVKMSKRRGEFVTFEDLINEVGSDAARFFFLMHSPEAHMDFDLGLAKERSLKNPVYYAQYAYVRAANIIKKANLQRRTYKLQLNSLNTSEDLKLIRELVRFGEVMEDTAKDYKVQRLTRYALELARAFHNFYEKERVLGEEKDVAAARLALVYAAAFMFKKLFGILGITAPQKM